MARSPTGFGHALCALDLYVGKSREVAVVGDPAEGDGPPGGERLQLEQRGAAGPEVPAPLDGPSDLLEHLGLHVAINL